MPKQSAGIVAWRRSNTGDLEIFLVHPGGPLWKNKDVGAWSIPKGEYAAGEDAFQAAKREFAEETGNVLNGGDFVQLNPVKLKSGKIISAWAVLAPLIQFISSNTFEMEWPPRSGKKQHFPETDKGEWLGLDKAKEKINPGQIDLVDQLEKMI